MKANNIARLVLCSFGFFAILSSCNAFKNTETDTESHHSSNDVSNNNDSTKERKKYICEIVFSHNKSNVALAYRNLSNSEYEHLEVNNLLNAGDIIEIAEDDNGKITSCDVDRADVLELMVEKRDIPGEQSGNYDLYSPDLQSNYHINTTTEQTYFAVNKDYSTTSISSMTDGTKLYLTYRKDEINETISDHYLITPYAVYSYNIKTDVDFNELDYNIPETIDVGLEVYSKYNVIGKESFFAVVGDFIGYICNEEDYSLYKSIYGDLVLKSLSNDQISISNQENLISLFFSKESSEYMLVKGIYSGPYLVYKK